MKEIRDTDKVAMYFAEQQKNFLQKPPVLKLVEFEKGELLNEPFQPIRQFYIIVKGSVSIYDVTEEGSIRYISRAGTGTLLGDMEFGGAEKQMLCAEAAETMLCLAMPFRENQSALENDPLFLRFVLRQLTQKLLLSSTMDVVPQTLEEKVLLYLRKIQPDHEISSVNQTIQLLHCSRRQLQRVLKKLCDEELLIKTGRGCYQLFESESKGD